MKGAIAFLLLAAACEAVRTDKDRPVTVVIEKLKEIEGDLEKSMKDYKNTYETIKCWCKNGDRDKTNEIAAAEEKITSLNNSIESGSALSAKLSAEIENTKKELAANIKALQDATALREKELAEFNEEEKSMLVWIKQLEDALVALGGHEGGVSMLKIGAVIAASQSFGHLLAHPDDLDSLKSLVQENKDYFDAAGPPGTANSHNSKSNVIIGILKNMKEEFRTKLEEAQQGEQEAQKNFDELKATKEKEIALGQETVDKKTKERAETDAQVAADKQALVDTRELLSASNKYLMDLKKTCQDTDQQWEEQQKAVNEEMKAVREAIDILDSDQAHESFAKTGTTSFIQLPSIGFVATRVQLNAFAKVKKQIDTLIADMKQQQKDEDAKLSGCHKSLNENELASDDASRTAAALMAQKENDEKEILAMDTAIAENEDNIHKMKVEQEKAAQIREQENAEHQTNMANSRDSIEVLNRALTVLRNHFNKGKMSAQDKLAEADVPRDAMGNPTEAGAHNAYAFAQITYNAEPVGPPPPAAMVKHSAHGGAQGVLSMIQNIINDVKKDMAVMAQEEKDAQADFETQTKQFQENTEAEERAMATNQQSKADAEERYQNADKDLKQTNNKLEALEMTKQELHKECDYLIKNGAARKEARQSEINDLNKAKHQLSGMDLGAMMADPEFAKKHGITEAVKMDSKYALKQSLIASK